jgi:hypothetical protein
MYLTVILNAPSPHLSNSEEAQHGAWYCKVKLYTPVT